MILNFRKKIVIMLSLLMGFCNVSANLEPVQAENATSDRHNNVADSRMQNLFRNNDWKKLCTIWKKFNQIEMKYSPGPKMDLHKTMQSDLNTALNLMQKLETSKLLTNKEQLYLKNIFTERIDFIEYEIGMVKCYDMSMLGFKIVEKREDLEKRYDILENLFKENKINSEAYNKAVDKIKEDFQFIQDNSYGNEKKSVDSDLLYLLIRLNN